MNEKGFVTAKLAYLKYLELVLDSVGVKSSNKLKVAVEPILSTRVR